MKGTSQISSTYGNLCPDDNLLSSDQLKLIRDFKLDSMKKFSELSRAKDHLCSFGNNHSESSCPNQLIVIDGFSKYHLLMTRSSKESMYYEGLMREKSK